MSRSRRDPLRELSRKFPGLHESWQTLISQHDRAAGIVGVALLEASLERLLVKKLPNLSPALEGRLFKNRGPLSDFDSKILIATALDFIPDNAATLFNSLRAVRNVFGHSMVDVSFETKEIIDEVKRYILPFSQQAIKWISQEDEQPAGPNEKPPDTKTAFLVSTLFVLCILDGFDEDFDIKQVFSEIASF